MKTVLFNGEEQPKIGDTFIVKDIYQFEDGMYGPRIAVILQKVNPELKTYARKHLHHHLIESKPNE